MTEELQTRETQPTKTSEQSGVESQKESVKESKPKDKYPPPTGSLPRSDKRLVRAYMREAKSRAKAESLRGGRNDRMETEKPRQ